MEVSMRKPIYIKVENIYNQPLNKVWGAIAIDFGNSSNYNPDIKSSYLESEISSGKGTIRHCDFHPKGYIKEEIIDWKDNEYFKLKMLDSSFPMSFFQSKFSFSGNIETCVVTQEFWYRVKFPMGWISGLMKNKMTKALCDGLEGFEKYFEINKSS
jgi:polyketide cyclase/dehydrase/lipid transport protein